ncbi:aspartyl/asparaginyl beta-hydroxylase domain-containing protein [Phytopseudomonas daroniae]|uniref:aspartyl/asparaginyl beta-hydroxylase domain-containing protein n=1 Tax=Phytopseudomonas daroniae TaxID=2487519 RepID=UPI00103850CE|nr:aspartyl/asparaginyl beta-hydroxylase domain-containing protein [Pseudomonas daroniae]TBU77312.1 aspartyl/asparaginyl beta-hydroxylase domain-containing protein [Pseudomonas daroniae]
MNYSLLAIIAIAVYSTASIAYVYRWRGNVRYASLTQYLRKSWPILAPLNCMLYMTTRASARSAVLDAGYLQNIAILRDNWRTIRDEALALQAEGVFEATKAPGSAGYYDVGFRTFYKRGWSKFYLKWYGTTHRSSQRLCPRTLALLAQVPQVRGAMFSILPAGSELTMHSDPLGCSFRYHMGLSTPNSEHCHITVDGRQCVWHDGGDFVFDETYPHFARNDTGQARLILMCDVDRPMNVLGRLFNRGYRLIARGTVVPNTAEDARGVFSALFSALAPMQAWSLRLRAERRRTYKALKYLLNLTLLALLMALLFGAFSLIEALLR